MVKVCQEWYPKGYHPKQLSDGFYFHEGLKKQIDYLLKNVKNDWDFTIIISGEGEVRVGKSVLAMQIAAYWTYQIEKIYGIKVPFSIEKNFVLDGKNLIKKGNELGQKGKYAALIFDEAGADLEGAKAMRASTQAVKDYLRECGQYNMLTILVIPEFFDLPKGVALNRSIFMVNVYYLSDQEGNFLRGYFKFYSRPNKKYLYLNGKKNLDYKAWKYDFYGNFINFYPIDEKEYRRLKAATLKKRDYMSVDKKLMGRNFSWWMLVKEFDVSMTDLAKRLTDFGVYTAQQTISDALRGIEFDE